MKHFKLTDSDLSHIFKSPIKLAIFIAVFATVILCVVILIQLDLKSQNNIKRTENFQNKIQSQTSPVKNYQTNVKKILDDFLSQRTQEEFKNPKNYKNLASQTLKKILNLTVPADYKEFHLRLVVLLDKEIQNCLKSGSMNKELEKRWNKLLSEYSWLNN